MATVQFLGPINKESIKVDICNLQELKVLFAEDNELKEWLSICSIAVNDTLVSSLDKPINPNDTISLLPPVCGG